ncbi:hypothetical protein I4F81_005516 [Pyropia yezoensis]|uniref:Uncharacterized protein n=1 Tax=Pyropia yezoensis TaxID=2788 RepID=A0ACC3BYD2_PYRYE|nr:hypothetical protein I4F81_005516 [Neopyropia yezoensis]
MNGPGRPLAPRAAASPPRPHHPADAKTWEAAAASAAGSRPATVGAGVTDGRPPLPPPLMTRTTLAAAAAAAQAPTATPCAVAAAGPSAGRSAARRPGRHPTAAVPTAVAPAPRAARPRRQQPSAAPPSTLTPRGGVERPLRRRRPAAAAPSTASSAARRPRPAARACALAVAAAAAVRAPLGMQALPSSVAVPPRPPSGRGAAPQRAALPRRASRGAPGMGLPSFEAAATTAPSYVVQVPFAAAGVVMLMSPAALEVGSHGTFQYEVVANAAGSPVFNVTAAGGLPGYRFGRRGAPPPLEQLPTGVPRGVLDSLPGAGALARWHSFVLILKKSNDVKVTSEGRDDAATADS